ncbi:hypothetical protein D3C71_1635600 [compost metagenome]
MITVIAFDLLASKLGRLAGHGVDQHRQAIDTVEVRVLEPASLISRAAGLAHPGQNLLLQLAWSLDGLEQCLMTGKRLQLRCAHRAVEDLRPLLEIPGTNHKHVGHSVRFAQCTRLEGQRAQHDSLLCHVAILGPLAHDRYHHPVSGARKTGLTASKQFQGEHG